MKTVTFDDTKWKLVPIAPREEIATPLTIQEQQKEWSDYINRCDSYDPPDRRHAFLAGIARGRAIASSSAVSQEICPTCGEDRPYTGTCGTSDSDTKALCKRNISSSHPDMSVVDALKKMIDLAEQVMELTNDELKDIENAKAIVIATQSQDPDINVIFQFKASTGTPLSALNPNWQGGNTKGYPKCAPGVDVPESEFQKPISSQPVLVQHRKPIVGKDGETIGYTNWIDGSGLDWWPHRSLYDAPSQPAVPQGEPVGYENEMGELIKFPPPCSWMGDDCPRKKAIANTPDSCNLLYTRAAPSQPVTDEDPDPVLSALMGMSVSRKVWGEFKAWQSNKEAALREKQGGV